MFPPGSPESRANRVSISISDSDNPDMAVSGSDSPPRTASGATPMHATVQQAPTMAQRAMSASADKLSLLAGTESASVLQAPIDSCTESRDTGAASFLGRDTDFSAMSSRIASIKSDIPTKLGREDYIPYGFEKNCTQIDKALESLTQNYHRQPRQAQAAAQQLLDLLHVLTRDVESSLDMESLLSETDLASRPLVLARIRNEQDILRTALRHLRLEVSESEPALKPVFGQSFSSALGAASFGSGVHSGINSGIRSSTGNSTWTSGSTGTSSSGGNNPASTASTSSSDGPGTGTGSKSEKQHGRQARRRPSLGKNLSDVVKNLSPRRKSSSRPESPRSDNVSSASFSSGERSRESDSMTSGLPIQAFDTNGASSEEVQQLRSPPQELRSPPTTSRSRKLKIRTPKPARNDSPKRTPETAAGIQSPPRKSRHLAAVISPVQKPRVDFSYALDIPSPARPDLAPPGTPLANSPQHASRTTLRQNAARLEKSPLAGSAPPATLPEQDMETEERRVELAGMHRLRGRTTSATNSPGSATKRSAPTTPLSVRPAKAARHGYDQSPGSTPTILSPLVARPSQARLPVEENSLITGATVEDMIRLLVAQDGQADLPNELLPGSPERRKQ